LEDRGSVPEDLQADAIARVVAYVLCICGFISWNEFEHSLSCIAQVYTGIYWEGKRTSNFLLL
jgi:hypothetical protein